MKYNIVLYTFDTFLIAQSEHNPRKVPFTLSVSDAEYLAHGSLAKLCTVFNELYGTMFTLVLAKLLTKTCIAKTRMPMGRRPIP